MAEVGVAATEAGSASLREEVLGSGSSRVRSDDPPSGGFRPAAGNRRQAEAGGIRAGEVKGELGPDICSGVEGGRGGRWGWGLGPGAGKQRTSVAFGFW
jgi:hypothetical protein